MPTHRKEIYELITQLEKMASDESPPQICALSIAQVRMLLAELEFRTGLAKAAITARIQRRG